MERLNKRGYKVFVEHNSNNYQVIALSNESLVASFFNDFKSSAGDSKKDYYPYEFEDAFFLGKDGLHDASKIITELLNLDLNTLFEINSIKLIQDIFYEKIKSRNYDFEKVLSFEDYYEFKKDNRGMIDEIHYS